MTQNKDEINLELLYKLADGQPYDPKKWWTCSNTFVSSFQKVEKTFEPEKPWPQIKVKRLF